MKIAVTGGTGFVGSHLVRFLAHRGHQVRTLSRSAPRSAVARTPGVETWEADVSTGEGLDAALEGVEAVIHLVAIIRETRRQSFEAAHVDGTRHVLEAEKRQGVRRHVQMSALGARDEPGATEYHRTKARAEELVRGSGIAHAIFRPSMIFGPGDEVVSLLARMLRFSPLLPLVGRGEFRLQPVWIGDMERALTRAAEDDAVGGTLEVGGPEMLAYRDVVRIIMRVQRTRRFLLPMPVALMRAAALVGDKTPLPVPLTRDQLRMLLEESVTARNDLPALLDAPPVRFEEGLRRYLRG
jgi:uncharacterized protein YbjT (DUF2867 family)